MEYLTEQSLGHALEDMFPGANIKHDSVTFVCENHSKRTRFRPDYVIEDLRLVVEFDGPRHYTTHSVVKRDMLLDVALGKAGWDVVHVPYFMQLKSDVVRHLFGGHGAELKDLSKDFPHGFIADKVIRPEDYCLSGLGKYASQLSSLLRDDMEDVYVAIRGTELHVPSLLGHVGNEDVAATGLKVFGHTLDMAEAFYESLKVGMCTCIEVVDVRGLK